jgi:predicted  nucleic acid-binding Zn-ribbon protein
MRIPQMFIVLAAASVMMVGCTSQKDPAEQAVAQGEAALNEIRADAEKFAPDQLKAPEATLARFKEALAQEKYGTVLEGIPQFNAEIKTLRETVMVEQTAIAAATTEWENLNAEVPQAVAEIENRMKNLTGSRLPKEVKKEDYEAARANLEPLKAQWAEATAAFQAGDALAAADKGRKVKQLAEEMKTQLAMNPV